MSRWGESHRHYHTPRHLHECLLAFDRIQNYAKDSRPAEFSLWYHDCFYQVEKHSNEQKSADMAMASFVKSGGDAVVGKLIHDLVLATAHTLPVHTIDAAMVTDADLWILGAPPERFDEYELQVRRENRNVQYLHFAKLRSRLLQNFLERRFIYRTPIMREFYEQSARSNIQRSLAALSRPGQAERT